MSSLQTSADHATEPAGRTAVPMKFEVTTLPVADVDRAKDFYQRLGWRLDIDFKPSPDTRGVQFTPPGSPASIQFGEGIDDDVARFAAGHDPCRRRHRDRARRPGPPGVDVGEIWHTEPGQGPLPGIDPQRRSYFSRASFADPDGNSWQLQEVTERLPGRV